MSAVIAHKAVNILYDHDKDGKHFLQISMWHSTE